ncbi:hypothetical protein JZ751_001776 [Albula glossodonta]|uniref:Major facilitator superfamily (MFS) profile domain-containing protein n=1 Tax=Albula glossodonta TaxID=121402 RepID=A0A8T2PUP9_9TELE|nr:hypothetical protein JZ751_001776 [Albula glossodonta]
MPKLSHALKNLSLHFFVNMANSLLQHPLWLTSPLDEMDDAYKDRTSLVKGAKDIAKEAKRHAVKKVNKVVDRASDEYSQRSYSRFQDEEDDDECYYKQDGGNYMGAANEDEGSSDATEGHDDEDEIYEGEYQGIPGEGQLKENQVAVGRPVSDGLKDRKELETERQADEEELAQQYELIIQECGHGRFQWQLFFVLGMALMSDGVEVFVVGFVLPSAETDMCVPNSRSGWLVPAVPGHTRPATTKGTFAMGGAEAGFQVWVNTDVFPLLTSALKSQNKSLEADSPETSLCNRMQQVVLREGGRKGEREREGNGEAHSSMKDSCELQLRSSIVYLGMMVGAFFWGGMSDKVGRKQCLLICMSVNGFFAFLSSFVQGYGLFLLCRMIAGFGIGGAVPIVFSFFAEVLAREKRGEHLSWLCMFWMIGGIYASAMAWAIIPHYGKQL